MIDPEELIRTMSLDDLLRLVVAHEDVRMMATAAAGGPESGIPASWYDTQVVPTAPTVPGRRAA